MKKFEEISISLLDIDQFKGYSVTDRLIKSVFIRFEVKSKDMLLKPSTELTA